MQLNFQGQTLGGGGDGGAEIPAGIIAMWGGAAADIPDGWALCDGQDGRPDLRNRFVLGAGNSYAVGAKGGEATHKLTVSEMPSHSHTISVYRGTTAQDGSNPMALYASGATLTSSSAGSGAAHNNMPPYYALCYIIKL